jgi:N-acetylglucosamine kinase-like BadF-type ATPase
MKYIIGADGGGTKTVLLASDMQKNIVAKASCGGMNYNYIGADKAAENFICGITALGLPADAEIAAVVIGDPSTDDITPVAGTVDFINSLRGSKYIGSGSRIFIKSDVYIALFGFTGGNAGVLMISGTGAMGAAFDRGGKFHVAGGWGRLTEDEGSGYYIAVNGIKAAQRYHDGIGKPTTLLRALLGFFDTDEPRKLIYSFYAPSEEARIAAFSASVARCADEGDSEARCILDSAADFLAAYTVSLISRAGGGVPVGIYGSVLTENLYIRDRFTKAVTAVYPDIKISVPLIKPEQAALMYAIREIEMNNK